jgi:hypothetical protein
VAAATTAFIAALTVALLAGPSNSPAHSDAYASPVSVQSLSGFSHPLTTTTTAPARHIASIPVAAQPVIKYQEPVEFKGTHKVPRIYATTMAPITTTTTVAPTTTVVAYDPATTGMGAPGSFQACVAWRESTDGEGSSDIYGILPYIWTGVIGFPGSPYYAPLATQDAAFWKLYDMDGTSPWAPYDGC